jgi:hypothetical protein
MNQNCLPITAHIGNNSGASLPRAVAKRSGGMSFRHVGKSGAGALSIQRLAVSFRGSPTLRVLNYRMAVWEWEVEACQRLDGVESRVRVKA